jgi:hypothetical protein
MVYLQNRPKTSILFVGRGLWYVPGEAELAPCGFLVPAEPVGPFPNRWHSNDSCLDHIIDCEFTRLPSMFIFYARLLC